ncbi:MAG: VCBS repeat-containing protein [Nitrospira sp. NTP1]|nr:VCBS repeat-containing protein [Nitrospira sp. NTP1]
MSLYPQEALSVQRNGAMQGRRSSKVGGWLGISMGMARVISRITTRGVANSMSFHLPGAVLVRDFNGDGKSDLTYHNPWGGQLYVFPSNGDNFGVAEWGNAGATELNGRWLVGDFNGDGRSDLTYHDPWGGQLNVFVSTGRNFGSASWGNAGATELSGRWLVGDFNGDGKSDLTYHNPWGGQLYVFPSTGSGFGSGNMTSSI